MIKKHHVMKTETTEMISDACHGPKLFTQTLTGTGAEIQTT